ncbi:MAG: MMPL family transporter [bacterium]|nr:RND family transporter [Gammaproteobacteria bacterium]HIL96138.1 RND family transporter [Pseudomonadales bacterium]
MSLVQIYRDIISFPRLILTAIFCLSAVAAWQLQNFTFDASADTLVVQGDPKLAKYLEMTEYFGGDEFLAVTYSRKDGLDLFSDQSLSELLVLQTQLDSLAGVKSIFSILDAPLIKSPPISLETMSTSYKTLRSPGTGTDNGVDNTVDRTLARKELTTSPLFNNFLISSDGDSSVIRIDLERDLELEQLYKQRDKARADLVTGGLSQDEFVLIEARLMNVRRDYVKRREDLISQVRLSLEQYNPRVDVFISGVPMVAADMIRYVKSDLMLFGSLVFSCIILLLYYFFRRIRWVVLPVLISSISILFTMGALGFMHKSVTVVSSNFISLLAIICISFSIHLIVRYRELLSTQPGIHHDELIMQTMQSKFTPCLYTALTTLLAFGSMFGSRIVPVEDFGWMMCLGIIVSFFVTYAVFPAVLLTLGKAPLSKTVSKPVELTILLSRFARQEPGKVLFFSFLLFIVSVYGLTLVSFENRFIDYFDEDTDIYKGMAYIDKHLGGTLPFDVYLRFEPFEYSNDEEDDFFEETESYPERYWYTTDRIKTIARLHDQVQQQASVGKVISLSTLEKISREFTGGEPLNSIELAYLMGELPDSVRNQLVVPYAIPELGITRISARIRETGQILSKDLMIKNIEEFAHDTLNLKPEDVVVTGMMVLFNDMLKQLAESQLRTLVYVVLATFLMFSLLLRSILLATIALIPNLIAAAAVIAFMGYAGIPMDMMTITIASISIGIGVDDAIHYLHRFRKEMALDQDIAASVERAHLTIGRAMYFTSMIIIVGFSVLAFSNFMPTVYFGTLTALAMLLALLANLTILPSLLIQVNRIIRIQPTND